MSSFIEELKWRGILYDTTPEIEALICDSKRQITGYIGFDPTADSLHVGSLIPIFMLKHFQNSGHKPIAVLGGATGMIGDPSGKSQERNLLNETTLCHNTKKIKEQLERFLNFDDESTGAELLNNYDWTKSLTVIDFARDIGKHITVNYMKSKDSVKRRLEATDSNQGMSFTEFTYQLFQGYDFAYLFKEKDCILQMGGSDQWGNITTGIELIRRLYGEKAHGLTCKLVTKADGGKFGKSEDGNIWLDANKTSPYKFYQFWMNTDDSDAERYIKIFTFLSKDVIETLIENHRKTPHNRLLQKVLASEITNFVHSKTDVEKAIKASEVLFGKATSDTIRALDEQTFLEVFEGVPKVVLSSDEIASGIPVIKVLVERTDFLKSNGEARRALKENAISINKQKVKEDYKITKDDALNGKYILLQRGKKNFCIVVLK